MLSINHTSNKSESVGMASYHKRIINYCMIDLIRLIKYFLYTLNPQRLLFPLSFIMYGVGDGITAAYMMSKMGIMSEINPIVRFIYASHGRLGVVSIKMLYAFVILFFVWRVSKEKNTYWAVTGFLLALFIGGIMLIRANLMAANDMVPQSAILIIFTYLSLVFLFMMIGDMMDKLHV